MKRSFPPPAREALCALVGVLACVAACEPNQDVLPGPPALKEITIVSGGTTPTTITADTPDCPASLPTMPACNPMADPPDGLCRQAPMNWCNCLADPADATGETFIWDCSPFTNVTAVIAVFDRLLDTTPFDPAGVTDVVTTMGGAGAPEIMLLTDYSATGAADGLIFNLYSPFFGNFRANGPSLFSAPQPEFPSGTTVTVSLQADKVRSKDRAHTFTGDGLLQGGTLVFTMAPFSAVVLAPQPETPDGPATPAMVAFTNFADPPGCGPPTADTMDEDPPPCAVAAHITATVNGTSAVVDVASGDGSTYTVTPMGGGAWPAGATVVITLDAATTNLLAQPIDMAAGVTFTAAAITTP
jgi:hypothetical protein